MKVYPQIAAVGLVAQYATAEQPGGYWVPKLGWRNALRALQFIGTAWQKQHFEVGAWAGSEKKVQKTFLNYTTRIVYISKFWLLILTFFSLLNRTFVSHHRLEHF